VIFAAKTLCAAFQRVFIVISVYFVIDSVRKPLDTPSYVRLRDYHHVTKFAFLMPSKGYFYPFVLSYLILAFSTSLVAKPLLIC